MRPTALACRGIPLVALTTISVLMAIVGTLEPAMVNQERLASLAQGPHAAPVVDCPFWD